MPVRFLGGRRLVGSILLATAAATLPSAIHAAGAAPATLWVGMAASPTTAGYWLVSSDGQVQASGGAPSFGSMAGIPLSQPIVGMAPTPSGHGYWLAASDGGIFSFGDAAFYGSTGAMHLNQPVVGIAGSATGHGYWLVARDGGIFTFGDAAFYGSTGSMRLNQPVVGMAATRTAHGYWLVAKDGGIFTFGDAAYYGSTGATPSAGSAIGMAVTPTGHGYLIGSASGTAVGEGDGATLSAVTYYGRPGSFGSLPTMAIASTGQTIGTMAIPSWAFHPGQAAYFTQVGPDGSVFVANEPQTDNQLLPTAADMVISVFDPGTGSFRNVTLSTTAGSLTATAPGSPVGGADISDIAITGQGANSRLAFTSAAPYHGWSTTTSGRYPSFGYLNNQGGTWGYDSGSARTADSIRASSSLGPSACPLGSDPQSQPVAECRGLTEVAQLPGSSDLVVTQYFDQPSTGHASGGLLILDPAGNILARYSYPNIPGPNGTSLSVHPREVRADPTGHVGNERFAVVFDVAAQDGAGPTTANPFPMQEFRFDGSAITALSAPVVPGDSSSLGRAGVETVRYDAAGNLWVAQAYGGTLNGAGLAVYLNSNGTRKVVTGGCAAGPNWPTQQWTSVCPPDLLFPAVAPLGIVRSLNVDPRTGALLASTMSGYVAPFVAVPGGFTEKRVIDLGLNSLINRSIAWVGPRRGTIDANSHLLWLPIQQLQTPAMCANYPCQPAPLDQWLVRVDLNQALA